MYRSVVCSIIAILLHCSSMAAPTRLPLQQAIEQHIVTVTAEASGRSYMQQGLKLTVKNTGSLKFILVISQGMVFKATDSAAQPFILVGEETVLLLPLKEATLDVQTLSADNKSVAAVEGQLYEYAGMCDEDLLKVLPYIKQNRLYNDLGQRAVWMLTNDNKLNTVYDSGNEFGSKKLQEFLITNTGKQAPEYFVESEVVTTAGKPVNPPKTLKVSALLEEDFDQPKKITLGIYNAKGEMIQPVFEDRNYGKAHHRFRIAFDAKEAPAGNYYIRLKEGDAILREVMIEVE